MGGLAVTEVRELTFSYGKRTVLERLSFSAGPGECLVLAGPNGSGKSTLLALLAGVLKPDSGEISVDGKVGYVPQGSALFEDMTVEQNLKFFAGLARCPLPPELPFGLDARRKDRVAKLSGGLKKQVSIACALLGDPQVILLDEPCAALDIRYRDELIALVREWKARGRTVLYAGHEPAEFYPFCDRLLFPGGEPVLRSRAELAGDPPDPETFRTAFSRLFARETM